METKLALPVPLSYTVTHILIVSTFLEVEPACEAVVFEWTTCFFGRGTEVKPEVQCWPCQITLLVLHHFLLSGGTGPSEHQRASTLLILGLHLVLCSSLLLALGLFLLVSM